MIKNWAGFRAGTIQANRTRRISETLLFNVSEDIMYFLYNFFCFTTKSTEEIVQFKCKINWKHCFIWKNCFQMKTPNSIQISAGWKRKIYDHVLTLQQLHKVKTSQPNFFSPQHCVSLSLPFLIYGTQSTNGTWKKALICRLNPVFHPQIKTCHLFYLKWSGIYLENISPLPHKPTAR